MLASTARHLAITFGFVFSLSLLTVEPVGAEDRKLTLGVGEWPPYSGQDVHKFGLLSLLASEVLNEAGYQSTLVQDDWGVIYDQTRGGKIDFSVGWLKSEARQKEVLFSTPIVYASNVFFHHKDLPFSWDSLEDLSGLRIGITKGYSYGESFREARKLFNLRVSEANTDLDNVRRLVDGKIDLFLVEQKVGRHILDQHYAWQSNHFVADEKPLFREPLHLIVGKSHPQGESLLKSVDKAIEALKSDGRYQTLISNFNLSNSILRLQFLTENYPPYNYLGADGEPEGLVTRIVDRILELVGVDKRVTSDAFYPWPRAYKVALNEPNTVLFAMTRTPEREALFKWVGPIVRSSIVLTAKKERRFRNISPDRLEGFRVCVIAEDVGEQLLRQQGVPLSSLHHVNSPESCARMLQLGRVDFWAYGSLPTQHYLDRLLPVEADYEEVYVIGEDSQYIAVSKSVSDEVVGRFQEALNYLEITGEIKTLIDAYKVESID